MAFGNNKLIRGAVSLRTYLKKILLQRTLEFNSREYLTTLKRFFVTHSVQTGSGAHPASYSVSTVGSFLGVKRPGREADHSPPSSAEIKNGGATTPLPNMCSWSDA
jgi:hypothetical protein